VSRSKLKIGSSGLSTTSLIADSNTKSGIDTSLFGSDDEDSVIGVQNKGKSVRINDIIVKTIPL
jgi:hypothetical protein